MRLNASVKLCLASLLVLATGLPLTLNAQETEQKQEVFARIDDIVISQQEFDELFAAAVRQKFYHGKVPEEELNKFRQQVADDIVEQVLIHREARRQGIHADSEKIKEGISQYDNRYQHSPEWLEQREQVIPHMIARMERKDLIEKLEQKVRSIAPPPGEAIEQYYQTNPEKFTEPQRLGLSVIILSVPPSASGELWQKAAEVAEQIRFRIGNGEAFEDIARQLSGHASAATGGDLGYVHSGMLDPDVQKVVEVLEISQLSKPLRVLEGVALFRLNGIQKAKLKPFAEVEQRAMNLLHRQMKDDAWEKYVENLKASANIFINKDLYVQNGHE